MSYLLLNGIFVLAVTALLLTLTRKKITVEVIYAAIVLLVLTVIFDSLIIHFGIVGYNPAKLLGIYVWRAPIEDFVYAVVSGVIVALLWEHYDKEEK